MNRKPGNVVKDDKDDKVSEARSQAAAAALMQSSKAKKAATKAKTAPAAAVAVPSSSTPAPEGVSQQSVRGRPANPATWTSYSLVTCCRGRACEGYSKEPDGGARATRVRVHVVVQQKLFCVDCQNVFCSACKVNHDNHACLSTPKGSISEEQLLAAVSS